MTRDEAEQLSILLLQVTAKLNQSGIFVQEKDSRANWDKYRASLGQVMGELALGLEEPIWERFPELKPEYLV